MGVDLRKGKKDYNVRYRLFAPNTNINNYVAIKKDVICTLHCKDITGYQKTGDVLSNRFQRDTTRATIETNDISKVDVDYILFCLPTGEWYRVESVNNTTDNNNQRHSARPNSVTQINIIRCE